MIQNALQVIREFDDEDRGSLYLLSRFTAIDHQVDLQIAQQYCDLFHNSRETILQDMPDSEEKIQAEKLLDNMRRNINISIGRQKKLAKKRDKYEQNMKSFLREQQDTPNQEEIRKAAFAYFQDMKETKLDRYHDIWHRVNPSPQVEKTGEPFPSSEEPEKKNKDLAFQIAVQTAEQLRERKREVRIQNQKQITAFVQKYQDSPNLSAVQEKARAAFKKMDDFTMLDDFEDHLLNLQTKLYSDYILPEQEKKKQHRILDLIYDACSDRKAELKEHTL